jgi:chromosome segregation ATPase
LTLKQDEATDLRKQLDEVSQQLALKTDECNAENEKIHHFIIGAEIAKQEIDQTKQELANSLNDLEDFKRQLVQAQEEYNIALQPLESEVAKLTRENDDLKMELAVRLEEIKHADELLDQSNKRTVEQEIELEQLREELNPTKRLLEEQTVLLERLQGRCSEMEKEMEILYHRIDTLQEVQPNSNQGTQLNQPTSNADLEDALKKIESQQEEIKAMRTREEELGWIGEMKEILNLLELYKNEITRLEKELVDKSNVASKFQELKEEELESLKVRYNDLVDCYNELEENFSVRIRQLRKNVLKICPEKSMLIEKAFEETMENPQQRVPKDHPAVMEERAEDEEDSGDRSAIAS